MKFQQSKEKRKHSAKVKAEAAVVVKEVPLKTPTSWGGVAEWYDSHLASDTYHEKVIMPRLFRMMGDIQRKDVLDLACGQGHVSRTMVKGGARVTGVDISPELVTFAKIKNDEEKLSIPFFASPSHKLDMLKDNSEDIIICVLAIQNIEKVAETFKECSRVLRKGGRFFIVMNHPAFRIPQGSGWGYDEEHNLQYRRVDQYLGEAKIKIDMTPGRKTGKEYTTSFHRPLQFYSKMLGKYNFAITRIEEWESHKKSERGPRQFAEDTARKEIPLFMCLEMVNLEK
jgi:ubiquinone/menaquinone biosynthesis C-methylase UbiE